MRDYNYYIEKAKNVQGFKYDNQVDIALGFKGSMTTMLKKGKRHLSDESMFKLAKLADENPLIALVDLNFMRTDGEAKKSYKKLYDGLKKSVHMLGMVGILTLLPSLAHAATAVQIFSVPMGGLALSALYIITSIMGVFPIVGSIDRC